MSVKAKEVNLTEGPFLKKIIVYIIPLMLTGLLQCLYNAVDLMVVGRFRGEIALAAVGTTGALTNLIVGLFMGLSVGAGVVVAQHIGALEFKRVEKVVHSSVSMAAILGIAVGTVGFVGAEQFLIWMGTPENVLPDATLYLRIIFCGIPASMVYNYCAAIVNATGETKKPLVFLAISGAVNLLLNIILVVFCGMGVEGVAIGTIASQYLSAVMVIVYMRRLDNSIRFSFRKLCLDGRSVGRVLSIGIPSGLQSVLFSLSNVLIQSSINSFGGLVMAGNAAAANLEGFCYIAMNSVSRAAMTFAGQNMGAKKYKNIKKITLLTIACATVIGIFVMVLILLCRNFFIGLYVSGEGLSAEQLKATLDAAMTRLFFILPLYFLCGIMEATCGILRGMGRSVTTMVISLIGACAFRIIWIETMFKHVWRSTQCIFISYPISWGMIVVANLIVFAILYRRLVKGEATERFFDKVKKHTYKHRKYAGTEEKL